MSTTKTPVAAAARPMTPVLAENQCTKCEHRWRDKPGGRATHHECPRCGSAYWRWLNYVASVVAR